MMRPRSTAALLAAALLAGCGYPYTPPALSPVVAPRPQTVEQRSPVTILVSIDAFRPDYLDRGVTPVLSRLAAEGVRAAMIPSFPTKTFPNHWTLVTGLVPDRHGVVGNSMEDVSRPNDRFTMATRDPFWWNAAEPIWVAAERAGIRSATQFWPGANVAWGGRQDPDDAELAIGGIRPSDWHDYAGAVTSDQRVDAVVDWLRRPAATRPRLVTLYLEPVDHAMHDHGPDSPELLTALGEVDRAVGRLAAGLAELDQPANLVIVSDHGGQATASDRVVALDRLADPADYRTVETGTYASLIPQPGREARLAAALLRPHPHLQCWRKEAIPARLHYGGNPRVPPFLCLAEPGWLIQRSAPTAPFTGGNHGWDNAAPAMRATFIGHGPAFRAGRRLDAFPNTDVYPLLRRLIGLPPATGVDGSDAPFRRVLR